MDTINTEAFIDAVRIRTSLWDSSATEFRDKSVRARKWEEIALLMFPDFHCRDPKEKTGIILELQKKWKHVRDAYIRSLRLRATTTQGKNMRPYLYEKKLEFLRFCPWKSSNEYDPSHSADGTDFEDGNSDIKQEYYCYDDDDDDEDLAPILLQQPAEERLSLATFGLSGTLPVKMTPDRVEPDLTVFGGESDDMLFFRSLLPLLESLSLRQKIKFRMDVMQTALAYSENCENEPSSSYQTIPPSAPPASTATTRKRAKRASLINFSKKRRDDGASRAARDVIEIIE
ncbi:uncharacterized protein LOC128739732 [Sabethes cyaneus]|uniref:uncharacterized protein LOC128739732 n=1 Tax=Sabethes cyaneus TaxID=53552 RepID=UPI00237ECCA6|nr:uncharacterized protein LOC128739732 [Sabethes cyaneus]